MTHGSLFSGIGGFDLAAQWMGWENIFHCEWNPFGQKVLKYYWPNAELFTDITKSDFKKYHGTIDIISGGFPCQPYSQAGKRKGKEDERHLWPEMLRTIREVSPRWVVGENVLGLVNWSGGLVFHEVQADMESEGYEVFPYVLPACAKNAPHRRDRVWFVAYRDSNGQHRCNSEHAKLTSKGGEYALNDSGEICQRDVANTYGQRQQRQGEFEQSSYTETSRDRQKYRTVNDNKQRHATHYAGEGLEVGERSVISTQHSRGSSQRWDENWYEALARIWGAPNGLSGRLDTSAISKTEWRRESLKAFGNAIVPSVAFEIFKAIQSYENINP